MRELDDVLLKEIFRLRGSGGEMSLLDALTSLTGMDRESALELLGRRFGMETVNLSLFPVDPEAVAMLPKELALRHRAVGIYFEEGSLCAAMADPLNYEAVSEVTAALEMPVTLFLADERGILETIEACYSERDAKWAAMEMRKKPVIAGRGKEKPAEGTQAPVVKLLDNLLMRGYSAGASDIHVEPSEQETEVRMRVDGMLLPYVSLPKTAHPALIARIKIMSGLDVAKKRGPQDGHCRADLDGVSLNLRVSIIPTIHGEKAVLRFLTTSSSIDHEEQFGMDEENAARFERMLSYPHGIIYLTGPTGSGKTTTLYLALEYLAGRHINISTIEDPVEKSIQGINQMQVNRAAGLTFETGLRALLRQDPDVMMVGETRDSETAKISARAALTGHLVLSTLHTNDAVSSIVRLRDLGLLDYLIANAVIGIVAQRLVRKLCPNCAEEYEADEETCRLLGVDSAVLRRSRGCHLCGNTGYKGRIAVHEILVLDKWMRKMVVDRAPIEELYRHAVSVQNMKSLQARMRELVLEGVCGIEEYYKIAYELEFLYEV